MIRSNPADRVERPRKEKFKSEVYKAEELEQLFTAIQGDPAEFGVIMAAFYGLRRSEIKCRSCRTKKESPHFLSGIPYGLANGGGSRFRSILWQGRAVRPTHTPQIKKKTPPDKLGEFFLCRWWGSNPHVLLAQGILSPPRLPFRHTGVFYFTDNTVIIADFSPKIKMQLTTHQISANFLSLFGPRACILRETTSYPKEYSL